jgi:hypothetical protein
MDPHFRNPLPSSAERAALVMRSRSELQPDHDGAVTARVGDVAGVAPGAGWLVLVGTDLIVSR